MAAMKRRAHREESQQGGAQLIRLPISEIGGGMLPERQREDEALCELAASIAKRGLLQPIVVRRTECASRYTLVLGARRLAACRMLGRREIDALIIDCDEKTAAVCLMEEHLTRRLPCVLDEAQVLSFAAEEALIDSAAMNRRRNMRLSLLALTDGAKEIIRRYALSSEQAAPLGLIRHPARQEEAAMIIAERELTPSQARRLAVGPAMRQEESGTRRRATRAALSEIHALARRMRAQGMDAAVSMHSLTGGVCVQILLRNGEKGSSQQEMTRT